MKRIKKDYTLAGFEVSLSSGEMIRELRTRMGWSQSALAKRAGMAVTNLSHLENNRTQLGKHRAIALAKAFGVHPSTIMFPGYAVGKTGRKVA